MALLLIFIFGCLDGAFVGYLLAETLRPSIRRWRKRPWTGYDMAAIAYVVGWFANSSQDLKIEFRSLNSGFGLNFSEAQYDGTEKIITIDPYVVDSPGRLVAALLHEICHHNQADQGRIVIGMAGRYQRRPIECEARAFSRAWKRTALRIYRSRTNPLGTP